jgi:hypothetical protein
MDGQQPQEQAPTQSFSVGHESICLRGTFIQWASV